MVLLGRTTEGTRTVTYQTAMRIKMELFSKETPLTWREEVRLARALDTLHAASVAAREASLGVES